MFKMKRIKSNLLVGFAGIISCGWLLLSLASCSKAGTTSNPLALNIRYQVVNLSPDLLPVNLYINLAPANSHPYYFAQPQGYFYVNSTVMPYQIRSAEYSQPTVLNLNESLSSGARYTLYILGTAAALDTLLTVDTAATPPQGYGGLRFLNVSPTATGGLDVLANNTLAFTDVSYKQPTKYINLPAGNYQLQIEATGTSTVLATQTAVTIQNGRLYTLFAYGYTSRADSAAFNSQVTSNTSGIQ